MGKEYIEREAVLNDIGELFTLCRETLPNEAGHHFIVEKELETHLDFVRNLPAADVRPVPEGGIGEMSDGYHTFNGLYYQRMVLFAALVKVYKGMAWKSWRHEDGELCFGKDNYFIVGIDTPKGSYTYHYHGEHWDLFDCEELPVAKHWDGHTEKDVTRLLSLDVRPVKKGRWIRHYEQADTGEDIITYPCGWVCSECGRWESEEEPFCNCGADMREES